MKTRKFNTANLSVGKRYRICLRDVDGTPGYPIMGNFAQIADMSIQVVDYQIGHLPQMGELTLTPDKVASIDNFSGPLGTVQWSLDVEDPPPAPT